MQPYTAAHLEERKSNKLKDFLSMSGYFHVTHLITFSESALDVPYLRICRLPRGPTLSFKIRSYSLMQDIKRIQKKTSLSLEERYKLSAVAILNGFPSNEPHAQLLITMFQNMFPTISVKTLKLRECKRIVMFNYNKETKSVQMRHYVVRISCSGISKGIKKVGRRKPISLRKYQTAGEYIKKAELGATTSDSELDETGVSTVTSQRIGRKITENSSVRVRLVEVGPRLDLELFKIEDGFFEGKTIYHAFVVRTPQEEALAEKRMQQEKALKERRRLEQETNVKTKQAMVEEKIKNKEAKRRKRDVKEANKGSEGWEEEDDDDDSDDEAKEVDNMIEDIPDLDDVEYYRQEFGKEPDAEFVQAAKEAARREKVLDAREQKRLLQAAQEEMGNEAAKKKKKHEKEEKSKHEKVSKKESKHEKDSKKKSKHEKVSRKEPKHKKMKK